MTSSGGDRLEILFLCHRIPYPPDKGDKIRSYHELVRLARRHSVTLGTFIDDPEDWQHVDAVREMCRDLHVEGLSKTAALARGALWLGTGRALSLGYFRTRGMAAWVRETTRARRFDAVFAFSSSMGTYALEAETDGVRVMDLVDLDSEKWDQYALKASAPRRWLYAMEAKRMRAFERRVLESFDHSIVCTEAELETLEKRGFGNRASAIANGVEPDRFSYDAPSDRGPVVVFTGAMDYKPNVDGVVHFVRDILPRIRAEQADVEFRIVGRRPAPAVVELGEEEGVVVTGAVDEIAPELHRGAVAVAPLRIARGVQNKVLEAMCCGTPVVSTSIAFEGIDADPGEHAVIADDPEAFAKAVLELMADAPRRVAMASAARRVIEERYSWDRSVDAIEAQFHEGLARRRAGRPGR